MVYYVKLKNEIKAYLNKLKIMNLDMSSEEQVLDEITALEEYNQLLLNVHQKASVMMVEDEHVFPLRQQAFQTIFNIANYTENLKVIIVVIFLIN